MITSVELKHKGVRALVLVSLGQQKREQAFFSRLNCSLLKPLTPGAGDHVPETSTEVHSCASTADPPTPTAASFLTHI